MTDIAKEIEEVSETLEKSTSNGITELKATILDLGPEKLKKAVQLLSDEQKRMTREVLADMAKSFDEAVSTTDEGEQYKNSTRDFDKDDEDIVDEARGTHRNQGGNPIEGWEGQVIKSTADMTALDQERGEVAESLRKSDDDKEDIKEIAEKEAKQEVAAHNKEKHYGKKKFKKAFESLVKSGIEKDVAVPALAKKLGASSEEAGVLSEMWDVVKKAMSYKYDDSTTGKDNPEKSQVETPETQEEKKPNKPGEDPGVPAPKSSSTTSEDVKDQTKETADEAVSQAPAIKKSETEEALQEMVDINQKTGQYPEFELTKSEDPFSKRKIGQNAHWDVDAYIAAEHKEEFFAETIKKSEGETKDINDLIEAGEDMSKSSHIQQVAERFQKESGAYLVKSFEESDLFASSKDMWAEEGEDSLGKSEGSRGGKVIGHTKSGKPIYAAKTDAATDKGIKNPNAHKGWTDEDHTDAALHHAKEVKRIQQLQLEGKDEGESVHPHVAGKLWHINKIGKMKKSEPETEKA